MYQQNKRLRGVTLLVTLLLILASLAPSTVRVRGAGSGGSYPCASHRCGCTGAEDCATACCCFPAIPEPVSTCCADEETVDPPSRSDLPVIEAYRCSGGLAVAVAGSFLFLVVIEAPEVQTGDPGPQLCDRIPSRPKSRMPAPVSPPPRRSVI